MVTAAFSSFVHILYTCRSCNTILTSRLMKSLTPVGTRVYLTNYKLFSWKTSIKPMPVLTLMRPEFMKLDYLKNHVLYSIHYFTTLYKHVSYSKTKSHFREHQWFNLVLTRRFLGKIYNFKSIFKSKVFITACINCINIKYT